MWNYGRIAISFRWQRLGPWCKEFFWRGAHNSSANYGGLVAFAKKGLDSPRLCLTLCQLLQKKIRGNYFASATFVVLLVTCSKEFYQNIDIFHELQVDTFITNLNIIIFWVLHNDKFLSTIWHNYLIHASDQCIMGKSKAKSSTVGFRMMHCKPV